MGAKRKKPEIFASDAAAALGRLGGLARARNLSADELSTIGRKAAKVRSQKLSAAERRRIAMLGVQARLAKIKERAATEPGSKGGRKRPARRRKDD